MKRLLIVALLATPAAAFAQPTSDTNDRAAPQQREARTSERDRVRVRPQGLRCRGMMISAPAAVRLCLTSGWVDSPAHR